MNGEHPNSPAPLSTDRRLSHTPGPWQVSGVRQRADYKGHMVGPDGDGVTIVPYNEKDHAECLANARLIAAAPDLLELAKRYAMQCAHCDGNGFTVGDDGISGRGPDDVEPTRYACEDCADIREVIAKAEGRS